MGKQSLPDHLQFYAWEKPFRQNIYDMREKDLKILRYGERVGRRVCVVAYEMRSVYNWGGFLFLTLGFAPVIAMGTRCI